MENIFYAALALHIAGKRVNKENIRAVLKAAGTPVNEPALDAMAAFVEALEVAKKPKQRSIDLRIIKFLTSELNQHKAQTGKLQSLLEELTQRQAAPKPETGKPAPGREKVVVSEEEVSKEVAEEAVKVAPEARVEEAELGALKGRYVYGVAPTGRRVTLGQIGIEGSEVYTIRYKDLCAVVHNCPTEPYQSDNEEVVKGWVKTHQKVLDEAKERFGTLIPLGFDVIIQPKDDTISSEQMVKDWLREDYDRLRSVMEKIKGKDEYGVQISYDPKVMSKFIAEQSEEVRKIKKEIATKSPGMAYMYKQKLEKAVKAEMERFADEWFKGLYEKIKRHTDDIVVEKTKRLKDKVMLLNLSCLMAKEKVKSLGKELEKINNMEGFSVHFSGAWPPYSFVAKPIMEIKEG